MNQPLLPMSGWIPVLDGNGEARELFDRHYSRRASSTSKLFVGPGEKLVLMTSCGRAMFAWRRFISDDGQTGVNCAIFRNEGQPALRSVELIRAADEIADGYWPGERHFTYVNPRKVASSNPGYCFKLAGWRFCGITKKRKLHILERPAA